MEVVAPLIVGTVGGVFLWSFVMKTRFEGTRSLVRPFITVSLVLAYIVACFVDVGAVDKLETLTGVVIAFWFSSRANKDEAENGDGGS